MVIRHVPQKQVSLGQCDTRTGQRVYPPPPIEVTPNTDRLPEQQLSNKRAVGPSSSPLEPGRFMDTRLFATPPLGHATIVPRDQQSVKFTVLLVIPPHNGSDDLPDVVLWHNHKDEHDWSELLLSPMPGTPDISLFSHLPYKPLGRRCRCFSTDLPGLPGHGRDMVHFTLKYRLKRDRPWRWIRNATNIGDGSLHYRAHTALSNFSTDSLCDFFSGISPDIDILQEEPETVKTQLWSMTCPVKPTNGDTSGYQHHRLGKAKRCLKWFALVRLWTPWLAPRHGSGQDFNPDKESILLSFQRSDGLHVVCLAISGVQDVVTTFLAEDGNVVIKGRNDRDNVGTSRILVAVAESFEIANSAVMYHARKVILEYGPSEQSVAVDRNDTTSMTGGVKPTWFEEWYDSLTYCTWNGLGQNITAQKIADALDDLSKNDVTISNLVIDDGWQSVSAGHSQFKRGWSDFEADASTFPGGLKALTSWIKQQHPNIQHIAVWHAILGYWGGIDPNGSIAKRYKTVEVEKEPSMTGGSFIVVAPDEAQKMYNDFYSFLSSSGISAVKTDAQFFLDALQQAPDRRKMITEYQDAWTLAHLRHFSSQAISCMSQFPQALFTAQLPKNKPRLLVRNSDDFFPDVEASHPWHIFCNAHNSLFTQHLNVLPDWDMFQTSHEWAAFHAAARCVSGGPIYITDKPGEHNLTLIRQITAQTIRGKTVILRPHTIGRATDCYNAYDAPVVLEVGTYVGRSGTGSGILGCFNVCGQLLSEFVHLEDFPGTERGEYVVGSFRSGVVSKPMQRSAEHAFVGIELQPGAQGWDILTAYALRTFNMRFSTEPVKVAMMGLLGQMTGAAAVTGCDMYIESNGRLRIWTSLKALGTIGLWVSNLAHKTVEKDFFVMIFGQPIPVHCVTNSDASTDVLEIDIERAWKEMDLKAGWSNEVSIEVFMHP